MIYNDINMLYIDKHQMVKKAMLHFSFSLTVREMSFVKRSANHARLLLLEKKLRRVQTLCVTLRSA